MTTLPQNPRRYRGVMARPGEPLSVLTAREQWLVLLGLLIPAAVTALGLFVLAEESEALGFGVAGVGVVALVLSALLTWRTRRARDQGGQASHVGLDSEDQSATLISQPVKPRDWRGFALRLVLYVVVWTILAGVVAALPWNISPGVVLGPALGYALFDLVATIRRKALFFARRS